MQLKKSIVALSMTAGLVGGGIAGAVLGVPGLSGAQEDGTTTTSEAPAPAPDIPDGPPSEEEVAGRARERLGEVLAPLVEDGTITQAQADAVIDALIAAKPEHGPRYGRHGHGPGSGPGFGPGRGFGGLRAAAEALDMEPRELAEALRDGSTLADVARSRDVDPQVVIDALVADLSEHLDRAVESGRLTREAADERLAEATERITERVNEGRPHRRERDGDAEQRD